ncbi:MAG: hypothetical protein WA790_01450 [Sulfitobacter sp.]
MLDRFDQRILGGFRVVDHLTGATVRRGLRITAPGLKIVQTGSGVWAVLETTGMRAYTRAFDPVPAQAPQVFAIQVHDDTKRFDPIAVTLSLPRDADSGAVDDRVDTPVEFILPSAPGRGAQAGWSMVTVEVLTPQGAPVRGALVTILDQGTENERGWALTGQRGQAVVPLTGLAHMQDAPPPVDPDDDDLSPTVTANTKLDVRVAVDPTQPWPANPAILRAGGGTLKTAASANPITLKAGGEAHLGFTLSLS